MSIIVLNPTDRYFPGGTIEGKLAYNLTTTENIQDVKIELKGTESTKWLEEVTFHDRTNNSVRQGPIPFHGINRIIQTSENLRLTPGIDGPGTYEYPFKIGLPTILPNSHQSSNGEIVYHIKATVELSDGMLLYREVKYITIFGPINLHYLPNYNLEPVQVSDECSLVSCCTGTSGLLNLDLFLPKQFYTLDEVISPRIHISNKLDENIHSVFVELSKVTIEKVTTPELKTKAEVQIIDNKTGAGVPRGTRNDYVFDFNISRTANNLHNFGSSKLFKEWFTLKVIANIHDNEPLIVETRLIIGHVNATSPVDVVDHMVIPGGTPYPPPDHMSIPGGTPYPPPLPTAPRIEIQALTPRTDILEDDLPPSYHEVVRNPQKYSPNQ